ncbi:MAG: tRNA lysidine(34) synthetase TilS [Chloroflexi bacterium]|nr:tRNA lysidine(34) synthetase TilS [Chloroflexota bacterium]
MLVGVSGGPDSLALFHILKSIGYTVIPAHFDHLLRPGSTRDAETLEDMLSKMGYPLVRGTENVGDFASSQGLNIEEAARILRYRFLFDQARQYNAQAVVTAHTADDQVETVLMHILRGSGPTGLAGISYRQTPNVWDTAIPLVRPLLDVWRAEILDYCRENTLTPLIDETNADTRYLRNRIRNQLIPELEKSYNPQVKTAILRLSRTIQDEVEIVNKSIEDLWQLCCAETGNGYFWFNLDLLRMQPASVQRQLLHRALKSLVEDEEQIGYDVVQRTVDSLSQTTQGREIQLIEGVFSTVIENKLLICRAGRNEWLEMYPQIRSAEILDKGKSVSLGEKWSIQISHPQTCPAEFSMKFPADPHQALIDADKLKGPLVVRNVLPGERFQPYGMDGRSIKLSDYFINERLPSRARSAYPVVVCENEIVWIPGYRLAHPFRITRGTKICLLLQLTRNQTVL